MIGILLIGLILDLSSLVTRAVVMTTFSGWPALIQGRSPDIVVVRCLRTPDPDCLEEADSWDLSFNDITNFASLAKKLADKSDPVSAFLMEAISHLKFKFPPWELTSSTNSKDLLPLVIDNLNDIIYGPSIYDSNRFKNINLRMETEELRKKMPHGPELAQLNRMLLEDAYPMEITKKHLKPGLLRLGFNRDGVIQSDIEVVSVLKGDTKPGVSRLVSTYFLPQQGHYYLIFGHYFRRHYQAMEDFRVVPIGLRFEPEMIAGQAFEQQINTLLRRGLNEANQQLEQGQKEKALLEQAFPPTVPP